MHTDQETTTTMRQKRAKSYKKQMNIYLHTFKFREPYQTIIDDEIVLLCNKSSFDLIKGINRTIQAETKPMITQCCMQALYLSKNQQAIDFAKTFERRRCNHPPSDPKPPNECIESIVNIGGQNKHRYVVATQLEELRRALRGVPGVPLIHMNRSVMVMEPVSHATRRAEAKYENAKLSEGLNAKKVGYIDKDDTAESTAAPMPKKRKGPSEPNPLSIKKRKTEKVSAEPEQPKKKRTRRHKSTKESGADNGTVHADEDGSDKPAENGEGDGANNEN